MEWGISPQFDRTAFGDRTLSPPCHCEETKQSPQNSIEPPTPHQERYLIIMLPSVDNIEKI
ncbi:hypothetical protein ACN4EE_18400 [Geminocystis sp. CENA526]|uniref:hypothetical protein n=1 Tax=Geminocystis sp. CENA526 TaxID=1355871 RepID=UPI003D6EACEF